MLPAFLAQDEHGNHRCIELAGKNCRSHGCRCRPPQEFNESPSWASILVHQKAEKLALLECPSRCQKLAGPTGENLHTDSGAQIIKCPGIIHVGLWLGNRCCLHTIQGHGCRHPLPCPDMPGDNHKAMALRHGLRDTLQMVDLNVFMEIPCIQDRHVEDLQHVACQIHKGFANQMLHLVFRQLKSHRHLCN